MTSSADSAHSDQTPEKLRASLIRARCAACEGGVDPLPMETAREYLVALSSWQLDESSGSISRQIQGGSFVQVIDIVNRIAVLAEDQQHHPDLHVTGYRHLKVVLTTHAIGGLSENDFIVAAKIDELLAA
ncbi:4a-hydroxytetrahydrobiopterin dehydratase [Allorhodopirellula heiligendammensis]|nr:4a-hydroxytetrahydrobiopterin dehydratase [Allorhodopirellula heiligendammensis]